MPSFDERLKAYNQQGMFGKWQLDGATLEDALLGTGSYGRVYKICRVVRDSHGGKTTHENALKVVSIDAETCDKEHKYAPGSPELEKLLRGHLSKAEREIDILRKLVGEANIAYFEDSRIIPRNDTREKSWDVLIIMERLVPLRNYLRTCGVEPGTLHYLRLIIHIWEDMIAALRVCEKNRLIHRDIKPGNVFYNPSTDCFKLGDFGEVSIGNVQKNAVERGTELYISPEIMHRAGADNRADMYSLAVMIYELFNDGARPFERELRKSREFAQATDKAIEKKACQERLNGRAVQPIRGIPTDVNAVLLRCLQCAPEKRYANCSELRDAVSELRVRYNRAGRRWLRSRKLPIAVGGDGGGRAWLERVFPLPPLAAGRAARRGGNGRAHTDADAHTDAHTDADTNAHADSDTNAHSRSQGLRHGNTRSGRAAAPADGA